MTLERRSARTLSLVLNCASVSASLTMTGRPVSSTLRTMLSLMAPVGVGDRLALDVARRTDARGAPRARRAGALGRRSPAGPSKASSLSRMRPFSAPGHLDDGVEHRLEQLVDVLHRHQLLAELVELAQPGELLVRHVELRLAAAARRRRSEPAGARGARGSSNMLKESSTSPSVSAVAVDEARAALLLAVDEDVGLLVDLFEVEVTPVEEHLHVRLGQAVSLGMATSLPSARPTVVTGL